MKGLKILTALLLAFCFGSTLSAQSENSHKDIGFGGPTIINTSLAGEWALEVGGVGGAFIGRHFYIGGGGFGVVPPLFSVSYYHLADGEVGSDRKYVSCVLSGHGLRQATASFILIYRPIMAQHAHHRKLPLLAPSVMR